MKIQDLSPVKLAKRVYNASQKSWALINTSAYDERAAAAGDTINARGQLLTRRAPQKDTSLFAYLIKNPVLTQMLLDSFERGNKAMIEWTNSLLTNIAPKNSNYSNSITGQKSGLLDDFKQAEPAIQASGHFLRDHFQVKTVKVARAAADFLKLQQDHAQTIAQQIVTDQFQGPQLSAVQEQVDALQAGQIDVTTFATDSLRHNLGLYSFGQYDHAISNSLVTKLNDQFGQSADTVDVDVVVAFKEAAPKPEIKIDYSAPLKTQSPAPTPKPPSGFRI